MKTQFDLLVEWKDVDGNEPRECDREALYRSGVRQAAFGVLKGETRGSLSESLVREDRGVDYVGEWKFDASWQLISRASQQAV